MLVDHTSNKIKSVQKNNFYVPLSSPMWISNMTQFRDLTIEINKINFIPGTVTNKHCSQIKDTPLKRGDYHPAKLSIYIAVKAPWGFEDYLCALFQNMIE